MAKVVGASFFNKPHELRLPNMAEDECVLVRKVDLMSLLDAKGDIPDPLTNMVLATLAGGSITQKPIGADPKELLMFTELINRVAIACFVEPRLTADPHPSADSELVYVNNLTFDDKLFAFNWAIGGNLYSETATFPKEQKAGVAAVSNHKSVSHNARKRDRSTQ